MPRPAQKPLQAPAQVLPAAAELALALVPAPAWPPARSPLATSMRPDAERSPARLVVAPPPAPGCAVRTRLHLREAPQVRELVPAVDSAGPQAMQQLARTQASLVHWPPAPAPAREALVVVQAPARVPARVPARALAQGQELPARALEQLPPAPTPPAAA